MSRVIVVDDIFLKGKFKGTLLAASAQDKDYSLYPLAFGIVDSENEYVWTWFFRGLKTVIPDASDLVFVSDRAHVIAKYGRTGLLPLVEAAVDAYTRDEFIDIFNDIRNRSSKLAPYLEESDFAKWARYLEESDFAKYNIMTTNISESLNSILNLAHEFSIMSLYETIRLTITTWFYELGKKLLNTKNRYEFEVKDETRKYIVHLENKQCICLIFDIDKIPCVHAIAAAKRTNKDENKFLDQAYLTETWAKAYA
ncbi:uncharacterized protein LOC112089283 [Eutrema salsugineum]|uniref:uncharacterized protein LOC112089283 n=1 Tax=Eutrema salsugineum TaxID=72664 RepID=UPI000CED369F|nr:uncharacterized protein LOC112089283 [Eutrema salsugineum]